MLEALSISENHGIERLTADDLNVCSVGISTGGIAEMRMAELPSRHIVATTIDEHGMRFAAERIASAGLSSQIKLKLEDVSEPLPYENNHFDYVYARLVLHYLPKDRLTLALSSLYRVLSPQGKLFVVVRSNECEHAKMDDSTYDPVTELTEYTETGPDNATFRLRRHFFSQDELAGYVTRAGFDLDYVTAFDEHLFKDFMRTVPDTRVDNLVELLATKP